MLRYYTRTAVTAAVTLSEVRRLAQRRAHTVLLREKSVLRSVLIGMSEYIYGRKSVLVLDKYSIYDILVRI